MWNMHIHQMKPMNFKFKNHIIYTMCLSYFINQSHSNLTALISPHHTTCQLDFFSAKNASSGMRWRHRRTEQGQMGKRWWPHQLPYVCFGIMKKIGFYIIYLTSPLHHLMANPTWYLWMVLSWTVRTLTMRLKDDIVPTKSSSAWVPQANGLMDGRFSRCCTSNGCRISPKKWSLGWNFHRVIPHANALWAQSL